MRRYTKLFWINSGPYNNLTARKFVLQPERRRRWWTRPRARRAAAARFRSGPGETRAALVAPPGAVFLDATVDPMVTCKTPGAGRDILRDSANNLYSGVTMADLEGFEERYPLNSRLVEAGRPAR